LAPPHGIDRRFVADHITGWMDGLSIEKETEFYDEANKLDGAEPWMLAMIGGRYHIDAAWAARGSGWANEVTPQGWQDFAKHLAEARTCLAKAMQLAPAYPEAAAELIVVSMGQQDGQERRWFDRATAAQIDYFPAYRKLRYALLPRWGGSYEQLVALADDCRKSGRYDTSVPYEAIHIIWDIVEDQDGSLEIWKNDRVREIATDVLQTYAKRAKDAKSRRNYQSVIVAMDWYREDFAAARALLDEMKGMLESSPIARFRTVSWRMTDQIYASTGSAGADVVAAQRLSQTDPTAARTAFAEVAKKMPGSEKGRRFVAYRMKELDWEAQFEKGDWVPIQPGGGGVGWEMTHGNWKVEKDGTLVGASTGSRMVLLCTGCFGRRYEIAGVVEIDPDERVREANGGALIAWLDESRHYAVLMRRTSQQVAIRRGGYTTRAWPADVKDKNDFLVQVWDDTASARVNGQPVFSGFEMWDYTRSADTRVGVGAQFVTDKSTVKFRDLKIRKLSEAPASVATRPATRPSRVRKPLTPAPVAKDAEQTP
jgi:hypothetical protein